MIQARQDSGLAQELVTGLLKDVFGKGAVVLDFLKGAKTALEPQVVGKVNIAHAALTDLFTDLVAAAQRLPWFCREGHLEVSKAGCAENLFRRGSAQKRAFLLYYKRL